jgi:hypothetical protein
MNTLNTNFVKKALPLNDIRTRLKARCDVQLATMPVPKMKPCAGLRKHIHPFAYSNNYSITPCADITNVYLLDNIVYSRHAGITNEVIAFNAKDIISVDECDEQLFVTFLIGPVTSDVVLAIQVNCESITPLTITEEK